MTDKRARSLIAKLKTGDWGQQYWTAQALVKIGSPAVPALIETLTDENLRDAALDVLQEIAGPDVASALIQVLSGDGKDWSASDSPHKLFRRKAARALGKMRAAQAVPALIQALQSPHIFADKEVAQALGEIGDPQAVPALMETLQSPYVFASQEAAEALGVLGDPQAVPVLIEALTNRDKRLFAGEALARALGLFGDLRAAPALIQTLQDKSSSAPVRQEAIKALTKMREDPHTVPALMQFLREEEKLILTRQEAVRALVQLDFPDFSALRAALKNEDESLGEIGAFVAPALVALLQDEGEDWAVRLGAAKALGVTARYQPDPAMRAALPILRRLQSRHPIYLEALAQIEAAAFALTTLPRPAAAPPPDARTLPRPVAGADVSFSDSKNSAAPSDWWRRLRRALGGF